LQQILLAKWREAIDTDAEVCYDSKEIRDL
jgi:hypothetical protein